MEHKERLRPDQRIRKQEAFKNLVEKGAFSRGENFYVWTAAQTDLEQKAHRSRPMLGIVVSRVTEPNAAKRNFLKRRIREIFRRQQTQLKPGVACLVKAKKSCGNVAFDVMSKELVALFKKNGAWA